MGWTSTGGTSSRDARTGRWSWQLTGQANLAQALTDVPNGTYTLSVWTQSDGAGAELYVKNYGAADRSIPVPAAPSWTEVALGDIAVSNGQAEIGVAGGGQVIKLDDFTLVRQ